jgi:hypothetical protein
MLLDASTFGGAASGKNVAANLEQHGIVCHVIPHGMIEKPKTTVQQYVNWTWHSTPTGEIVPVRN